jgi:hypothetical protein
MRRVVVARRAIVGVMVSNSVWLFMMPRARRATRWEEEDGANDAPRRTR